MHHPHSLLKLCLTLCLAASLTACTETPRSAPPTTVTLSPVHVEQATVAMNLGLLFSSMIDTFNQSQPADQQLSTEPLSYDEVHQNAVYYDDFALMPILSEEDYKDYQQSIGSNTQSGYEQKKRAQALRTNAPEFNFDDSMLLILAHPYPMLGYKESVALTHNNHKQILVIKSFGIDNRSAYRLKVLGANKDWTHHYYSVPKLAGSSHFEVTINDEPHFIALPPPTQPTPPEEA